MEPRQRATPKEETSKSQKEATRDLEEQVLKRERLCGDECLEGMKKREKFPRYFGVARVKMMLIKFDFCYPEIRQCFEKYFKLNLRMRNVSSVDIRFSSEIKFKKLLMKLFKNTTSNIKGKTLFITYISKSYISNKIVKSICLNLWNYTKSVNLKHFHIGSTYIQKIIISGRHLEFIKFLYCEITEQKWGHTFKNYNSALDLETVHFFKCSYVEVCKDKKYELMKNIMKGILNSNLRNSFRIVMEWRDKIKYSKDMIVENLDCEDIKHKIEVDTKEIRFNLSS
ncbi:unnamed protein product [Moneuplotes crassus]|uniref:Uncharacterized protein n=1 Tax=Euplotes crassus TaxID=5936 RepID=A0AAD1XSA7_EUPCR|nr:unnamed protein product [Moneuplotes crassus]